MKNLFFIVSIILSNLAFGQVFYGPTSYLLFNVSSEKCKYYALSTRSYSSIDTKTGAIEVKIRYEMNLESKNDSMLTSFKKDFLNTDSFPDLTLNANIIGYDKINKEIESTTPVKLKGSFEIHGVKKNVEFEGTLHYRPKLIGLEWVLYLPNKDFNLVGPPNLKDCISPTLQVKGNTHMYDLKQH